MNVKVIVWMGLAALAGCAPAYEAASRPAAPIAVRGLAVGAWSGELGRAVATQLLLELRQARFKAVDALAVAPTEADVKLEGDVAHVPPFGHERPSKIARATVRAVELRTGRTLATYRMNAGPAEVRSPGELARDVAGLVRRDFRPLE